MTRFCEKCSFYFNLDQSQAIQCLRCGAEFVVKVRDKDGYEATLTNEECALRNNEHGHLRTIHRVELSEVDFSNPVNGCVVTLIPGDATHVCYVRNGYPVEFENGGVKLHPAPKLSCFQRYWVLSVSCKELGVTSEKRPDACKQQKFTDRVRKVFQLANQEAQRFGVEYIGVEHILASILKEDGGVGVAALKAFHVDTKKMLTELRDLMQYVKTPTLVMGKLPFTKEAKRVPELAIEEARGANSDTVGTEHFLLAICKVGGERIDGPLKRWHVSYQAVKEAIQWILKGVGVDYAGEPPSKTDLPDLWPRRWDGRPVAPGETTQTGTVVDDEHNRKLYQKVSLEYEQFKRRLRRLYIPEREIFDVMTKCIARKPGNHEPVWCGAAIPKDVEVLPGVYHDFARQCFGFLLRHQSFEVVPDGQEIPAFSYLESHWEWVEIPRSEAK